jgi:hypothetical protein
MNPFDLSPEAKCWIYQSDRPFSETEKAWLEEMVESFVDKWAAHGNKLLAQGRVIGDYHVVLGVDENQAGASGCSIDSSVRFMKEMGHELGVDFFNRMNLLVEENAETKIVPFSEISEHPNAYVYNNLVQKIGDLDSKWKIKVTESPFYK